MYNPKTKLVIIFLGAIMLTVVGIGHADVASVDNLLFTTLCFFNALVATISIFFVFIALIATVSMLRFFIALIAK